MRESSQKSCSLDQERKSCWILETFVTGDDSVAQSDFQGLKCTPSLWAGLSFRCDSDHRVCGWRLLHWLLLADGSKYFQVARVNINLLKMLSVFLLLSDIKLNVWKTQQDFEPVSKCITRGQFCGLWDTVDDVLTSIGAPAVCLLASDSTFGLYMQASILRPQLARGLKSSNMEKSYKASISQPLKCWLGKYKNPLPTSDEIRIWTSKWLRKVEVS